MRFCMLRESEINSGRSGLRLESLMLKLNGYNLILVLMKIDIGIHHFVCGIIMIYGHQCK